MALACNRSCKDRNATMAAAMTASATLLGWIWRPTYQDSRLMAILALQHAALVQWLLFWGCSTERWKTHDLLLLLTQLALFGFMGIEDPRSLLAVLVSAAYWLFQFNLILSYFLLRKESGTAASLGLLAVTLNALGLVCGWADPAALLLYATLLHALLLALLLASGRFRPVSKVQ